jgi:hypothetical protein
MTPDEHTAAIRSLQSDVAEIKGTLNNGLRAMVQDQRTELATVKEDIQQIRDALTGHVAKEDVIYEIFKRVMNTGVTITGALIALLLSHRLPARPSGRSALKPTSPCLPEPPSCGSFRVWSKP